MKRRPYCSMSCAGKARRGVRHYGWKGGVTQKMCAFPGCENKLTRKQVLRGDQLCSQVCMGMANRGAGHPRWRGGVLPKMCELDGCGNMLTRDRVRAGRKFCSQRCSFKGQVTWSGKDHPNWKGGEYLNGRRIYVLGRGMQRVSRLVMEEKLGRRLTSDEIVHHINMNPMDDSPENLFLFPSRSEHTRFHNKQRREVA